MTPREFLDQVVRPNLADFEVNFGSIRYAHNAVASVDAWWPISITGSLPARVEGRPAIQADPATTADRQRPINITLAEPDLGAM